MKLTIVESSHIKVIVRENVPLVIPISVKEISTQGERLPDYKGAYTITPKIGEQVLKTKETSMIDDLTVKKIPYEKVSNQSGYTVTIGGI